MANEKRLIDANALMTFVSGYVDEPDYQHIGEDWRCGVWAVGYEISIAPTVDAVEVVRCKDCKSWEQFNACDGTKPHRCMNHDAIFYKRTAPDDFCSYGERKDK